MRAHLIQELNALSDSLGPDFVNSGLPREAASALEELLRALGSAKVVLINRHNAETEQWERMAKSALDEIDDALGLNTVEH
ncbi:hypothetical protein [Hyphomicrobium sp.]|uniref:hypothetical protein n=1 Tax=Hyphomicrobium sp. TaxID=82 RepID=UPI002FE340E2